VIRLNEVVARYSSEVVIGPVSLELPQGGIISLVGPNGAGKSTILTMIGRLRKPDSGTVEVAGHDVHRTPSKDVAKIVSRLTVRQLVGFGRFPYSGGRLTQEDEAQISRAVDFLNLTDLENRFLDELSGGQRQRAYVAMVLAQDTEYLLLDEPLNNLDAQHSVQMMQMLREAASELGRTVVIVMHDINFAAAYSDYIVAMDQGRVAYHGTPETIITDEVLSDVFRTPVRVIDGPTGKFAAYHR
jgi:iron complex transport system ATP-binding protein